MAEITNRVKLVHYEHSKQATLVL